MLRRPGSPLGRKRGFTPVIWIALISVSGVLVLAGAHLALGARSSSGGGSREGSSAAGGEGSERVPRVLLQGAGSSSAEAARQQQLSLRPDVEPQPVGMRRSGGAAAGDGDTEAAAVGGAAEEDAGPPEAEPPAEQLGTASDLATFAAKGTHCIVTPAHGKVRCSAACSVGSAAKPLALGACSSSPPMHAAQVVCMTRAALGAAALAVCGMCPVAPAFPAAAEACSASAQPSCSECVFPSQIALLFLTHGDLPHDLVWTAWLREARGLLPRSSLAGEQAFCLQQCDDAGGAAGRHRRAGPGKVSCEAVSLWVQRSACLWSGLPPHSLSACCDVALGWRSCPHPQTCTAPFKRACSSHRSAARPPAYAPQGTRACSGAAAPRPATRCASRRCASSWGPRAALRCCSSSTSSRCTCTPAPP